MAIFKPTGLKAYSSDALQSFVLRLETHPEPDLLLTAAEAAWLWPLLKRYAEQQAKREAELAAMRAEPMPYFPAPNDGRGTYIDGMGWTRNESTHDQVD